MEFDRHLLETFESEWKRSESWRNRNEGVDCFLEQLPQIDNSNEICREKETSCVKTEIGDRLSSLSNDTLLNDDRIVRYADKFTNTLYAEKIVEIAQHFMTLKTRSNGSVSRVLPSPEKSPSIKSSPSLTRVCTDEVSRRSTEATEQHFEGIPKSLPTRQSDEHSPWTTFKLGSYFGASIVLIVAIILTALQQRITDDWRVVFGLYEGPFLITLFIFLIGINIYGWRISGIDHALLFQLDPCDHLTEVHMFEIAGLFSVLWCTSVVSFLFCQKFSLSAYANPLALVVVLFLFLVNPTPTMRRSSRFWLIRVLGRMVSAPLFKVNFAELWLADQFISFGIILLHLEYFVRFYATSTNWYNSSDAKRIMTKTTTTLIVRTIVACVPAWFRFAQCLRRFWDDESRAKPNLINAVKYSTYFFVFGFSSLTSATERNYKSLQQNPYFWCWIMSMTISSSYTFAWDVKVDWGLFDSRSSKHYGLREEMKYSSPSYYVAVVVDFILRFAWVFAILLTGFGSARLGDVVAPAFGVLEIIRRCVWNFFRVENEDLTYHRVAEFKARHDKLDKNYDLEFCCCC